ncbi:MAG TPA: hypothetical protein VN722_02255 [Hanamia sp.]|nr:hypothetical protein [Hanamia sp.]
MFKKLMMKNSFNKIIFILPLCFLFSEMKAQDTTHRQTIQITSSYKPSLRNTVKINLYASPITPDTTRPRLAYNIPPQNLFFPYQPVSLKPLSLQTDTSLKPGGRNELKVGYGNLSTPYISGGFSFGDGKHNLANIYGDYISSRGKIENQDFSEINVKGTGSIFSAKNETYAAVAFAQHEHYLYGYDHTSYNFLKSDIRRSFQDLSATVGFRNIINNDLGINYDPHLEVHEFSRENKASETTLILNLPVEKRFSDAVSVKVTALGNFDRYQLKSADSSITNNLFQLAPELVYYSDRFTFHGGITPSWNNNELAILPNIYAEAQLQQNVLMIQAGWVGRYISNSYRTLSAENPFMQDPLFLNNTKEIQYYGGIKATVGKHFSFNAKAAFISYTDMPLFVNDTAAGNSFVMLNASKMNNLQIHGDMNFISQDKFTLTGALDLNSYSGIHYNIAKAWGLYPLKLTGSFRWNAFQQVLLKADVIAFSGAKALLKNGSEKNMKGGTDLSAGGEFKLNKQFSVWLDFDNILNSQYERWNNYPVYGFQVIGGLIVHF